MLHADVDTYVPLVYETFAAVMPDDGNLGDELPVTFADGIPVRFFRPGRLLAAWVSWVREGFPQSRLAGMVREGLLAAPLCNVRDYPGSIVLRVLDQSRPFFRITSAAGWTGSDQPLW